MASVSNNEKIVDFLISEKAINQNQAKTIISESEESGKDAFSVILSKKLIDEEELAKIKADFLKVPYINLDEETISRETLDEIPEESAAYYGFVPFEKKGKDIKVAMVDPGNIEAREALKFISEKHNLKTKVYLVSQSVFNFLIKQYRTVGSELETALKGVEKEIEFKKDSRAKEERRIAPKNSSKKRRLAR